MTSSVHFGSIIHAKIPNADSASKKYRPGEEDEKRQMVVSAVSERFLDVFIGQDKLNKGRLYFSTGRGKQDIDEPLKKLLSEVGCPNRQITQAQQSNRVGGDITVIEGHPHESLRDKVVFRVLKNEDGDTLDFTQPVDKSELPVLIPSFDSLDLAVRNAGKEPEEQPYNSVPYSVFKQGTGGGKRIKRKGSPES